MPRLFIISCIVFYSVTLHSFRLFPPSLSLRKPLEYGSFPTTNMQAFSVNMNTNDNTDSLLKAIEDLPLVDEMKSSFLSYALSTILGRALPDARDGLKPVHRRVLFSMLGLNLLPDSGYRKCARVVGEVLGKYHPHGDQSVYDALVRMAQDFVMGKPLIAGHGNFGSVDNDPCAAMRYTECKLSRFAYDTLLADIKEDTVDFIPNFDGNENEPMVLPARLPMLLVNGASGIAVGMATNIPPHNLGEICDGILAVIRNSSITNDELYQIIPAPDFPTGALILGTSGASDMYSTGKGSITVRAKSHIETVAGQQKQAKSCIVVDELPYMVVKSDLIANIAQLVNSKQLEGISDIRDESDRSGMRVVIELKRDANVNVVLNNLYKKTKLQNIFSGNMIALVENGKQPKLLTLRDMIDEFLSFRKNTILRRSAYRLKCLTDRLHAVSGLCIALDHVSEIIDTIRHATNNSDAKHKLLALPYNFSTSQTDTILGLRLGRLNSLESAKLTKEKQEITMDIGILEGILGNSSKVLEVIWNETQAIKSHHAAPRKSVIEYVHGNGTKHVIADEDLMLNSKSVVVLTKEGYIKRLPLNEFVIQGRGGVGKSGAKLASDSDEVSQFFVCNDLDHILFATSSGKGYGVRAHKIPLCSRYARGTPIPQVIPLSIEDENVTSGVSISNVNKKTSLVMVTANGMIKKTHISYFYKLLFRPSSRGLKMIHLSGRDELRYLKTCTDDQEVVVASRRGYAVRFPTSALVSTERSSKGTRAINCRSNDTVCDVEIINQTAVNLLVVTQNGVGKRIRLSDFKSHPSKGLRGVFLTKFKNHTDHEREDRLVAVRACDETDDIVISTVKGTIIRQEASSIQIQSRRANGVRLQSCKGGDTVGYVDIIKLPHNDTSN